MLTPQVPLRLARSLLFGLLLAMPHLILALSCGAAETAAPKDAATAFPLRLNVVFFTPADVTPPPGVVRRLTQVADYTEPSSRNGCSTGVMPPRARRSLIGRRMAMSECCSFPAAARAPAASMTRATHSNLRCGTRLNPNTTSAATSRSEEHTSELQSL